MILFPNNWFAAVVVYLASFDSDLFDGMAVQKFDQIIAFGGLSDMVINYCYTIGLLCILLRDYTLDTTLAFVGSVTFVNTQAFCF